MVWVEVFGTPCHEVYHIDKVFDISAATNKGVRELMLYVSSQLKQLPPLTVFKAKTEDKVIYTPSKEEPFTIKKEVNDSLPFLLVFFIDNRWFHLKHFHFLQSVGYRHYLLPR